MYGNIGGQTLQIWEHSVNKCLFALTSNLIKSELLSQYISGLCEQGYQALFPKNRTMDLRPLVPLILYSGVECYIEVQECCIEVEHCCIAVQECCIGSAVQCSAGVSYSNATLLYSSAGLLYNSVGVLSSSGEVFYSSVGEFYIYVGGKRVN